MMKKSFLVVITSILFAACNNSGSGGETTDSLNNNADTMNVPNNTDAGRSIYDTGSSATDTTRNPRTDTLTGTDMINRITPSRDSLNE